MNHANKITLMRIGLIPILIFLFQDYPMWMIEKFRIVEYFNTYGEFWAVGIFILAASTDKLDGYIARKHNQVTNIGKLLDPLADKLLVSVTLILLVQDEKISTWVVIAIIGREIIVNGLRILAAVKGVALAADQYGKIKLVFQVIAISACLMSNYLQDLIGAFPLVGLLMGIAVLLTMYSGYNYIKKNYKKLELNVSF